MKKRLLSTLLACALAPVISNVQANDNDPRAREAGIAPGIYQPGEFNAITDVAGVLVGQVSLIEGNNIRTGVTAIVLHSNNVFQNKVPAGFSQGNGFGKMMGTTQIIELGEIETPIVLTNTLSVPEAAAGVIEWTLQQPGNERVRSVNAIDRKSTRLNSSHVKISY